jgi:hypothetical protein
MTAVQLSLPKLLPLRRHHSLRSSITTREARPTIKSDITRRKAGLN